MNALVGAGALFAGAVMTAAAASAEQMIAAAAGQQSQGVEPPAVAGPHSGVPQDQSGNGTVIKPPANIDPGIKAPTPSSRVFATPVIKPRVMPAPGPAPIPAPGATGPER